MHNSAIITNSGYEHISPLGGSTIAPNDPLVNPNPLFFSLKKNQYAVNKCCATWTKALVVILMHTAITVCPEICQNKLKNL